MWISTEALFIPGLDYPRPPLTPQEAAEEPTTRTSHHPVWWYDDNPNSPVCRQHPQAGCLAAQCGHPTLWTWHMPSPIRSPLLLSICRKSSLITSFHSELCLPSRPTVPEAFQGKQKAGDFRVWPENLTCEMGKYYIKVGKCLPSVRLLNRYFCKRLCWSIKALPKGHWFSMGTDNYLDSPQTCTAPYGSLQGPCEHRLWNLVLLNPTTYEILQSSKNTRQTKWKQILICMAPFKLVKKLE